MHRAVIPLPAVVPLTLALAACSPNNAVLTQGRYIAFLSEGTALSLSKGAVDPQDYELNYNVDCREFASNADKETLQLDNPLRICGQNNWPPQHEEWATQAGFRVVTEPMAPWRGEALITSEGDLQLSFHHRPPGGSDMRFVIAVDPDFGPTTCVQKEGAEGLNRVPLDGDWVKEWSKELEWMRGLDDERQRPYAMFTGKDLEGGRLLFLNAYGYQLNPIEEDDQIWEMPEQWVSGAAQGRFVEEDLFHRSPRYGEPFVYNLLEVEGAASETGTVTVPVDSDNMWYCDMTEGGDPLTSPCNNDYKEGDAPLRPDDFAALDQRVRQVANTTRVEFERLTKVTMGEVENDEGETIEGYVFDREADPVFSYAPVPHTNFWRIPDGRPSGLDGWSELHYNYVAFSKDSVLEVGGSARGAFALALDAGSSSTRVFIQGKFEIDKIKADRWTTDNLAEQKQLEAGVELCHAASEHEADPSKGEGKR